MAESSSIGYAPFCTIFQVLHMSLIRCKNAKNIVDCHTCTTNIYSPIETISMDCRQKVLFENDLSLALLSLQHLWTFIFIQQRHENWQNSQYLPPSKHPSTRFKIVCPRFMKFKTSNLSVPHDLGHPVQTFLSGPSI